MNNDCILHIRCLNLCLLEKMIMLWDGVIKDKADIIILVLWDMSVSSPRGESAFWGFCFDALYIMSGTKIWFWSQMTRERNGKVTSFSHCCVLNTFLPKFSVLRPSLSGCCLVIKKTAKMFRLFKEGTRSCKLFHTAHKCSTGIKWALFWDDFYFLLCVGVGQWLGSIFTFPADFSKHGWFFKGIARVNYKLYTL